MRAREADREDVLAWFKHNGRHLAVLGRGTRDDACGVARVDRDRDTRGARIAHAEKDVFASRHVSDGTPVGYVLHDGPGGSRPDRRSTDHGRRSPRRCSVSAATREDHARQRSQGCEQRQELVTFHTIPLRRAVQAGIRCASLRGLSAATSRSRNDLAASRCDSVDGAPAGAPSRWSITGLSRARVRFRTISALLRGGNCEGAYAASSSRSADSRAVTLAEASARESPRASR